MEETNPCNQDPKEKKSRWKTIIEAISSPMDFLQHWSSKSPLLTVLAVVFLLQPVISTTIDLIDEWRNVKQDLDPGHRPVTKDELDIVNKKIDFLQQLIVASIDNRDHDRAHHQPAPVVTTPIPADNPTVALNGLQTQLATVQKKLDEDWKKQKPSTKK